MSVFVLVNGSTSPFFKPSLGLRQGCPLAPLFFLFFVEGLSRVIVNVNSKGSFCGIKMGVPGV